MRLNEVGVGKSGLNCTLVVCHEMVVNVYPDSALNPSQQPIDTHLINNHRSVLSNTRDASLHYPGPDLQLAVSPGPGCRLTQIQRTSSP